MTTDPAAEHTEAARAVLEAHERLGYPGLTQEQVQERQLARAAVSATLALAAEQRTANLIALGVLDASLGIDPNPSRWDAAVRLGVVNR